jgi:hypothetical protein
MIGKGTDPMHITMVKKRLADGAECRKCQEATAHLQSRGLWSRIDEIVWADENDPASPGMELGRRHGIERAPFFGVRDERGEATYGSVLQLVRERFDAGVTMPEEASAIDPDDVGGI